MSFKATNIFRTLLVGLMLTGAAVSAPAYPLSYYKTESALATGHWVKITVDGEGIFQITYDQLREWGFSDPSKVAVYGYTPLADTEGNFTSTHVDDLPQTATMHTADGRILFYGESDARASITQQYTVSVRRNFYDRRGVYFLSDSQPVKDIPVTSFRASTNQPFDTHYSLQFIEKEENNPGKGGVYYHENPMSPGETRNYTFRIKDFADKSNSGMLGTSGDAQIRYEYAQNNTYRSALKSSISDNAVTSYQYDGECVVNTNPAYLYCNGYGTTRFHANTENGATLADEDVTLAITNPADTKASYVAVDKVICSYPRLSRLGDERQLIMHYYLASPQNQRVDVRATPEGTCAWNVDNTFSITSYDVSRLDNVEPGLMRFSLPKKYNSSTGPCRIVVFNPAATHQAVNYAGEVANTNIHGAETPELVIITTATLADRARQLGEIHERLQGLKVGVFVQEDIFNEFSSGVRTPMAYRRMAKMFYDRERDVFKYILLYGGGTWDNRAITIGEGDNLVTFEAEILDHARDIHRNYTSDLVYGMLEDSYNPSRIHFTPTNVAVGRMNLLSPSQASSANTKIEGFLTNPPTPAEYLRVAIASDQGNSNAHFQQAEEVAAQMQEAFPGISITKAHVTCYPIMTSGINEAHRVLMLSFQRGQGFFGYSGHGNYSGLSGSGLLNLSQIREELYETPTFAYLSSCDLFCFDRSSSLMDAMIALQKGGIIAGVGASRSVYLEYNQPLYLSVANEYASAIPGRTYGEIFARGRNALIAKSGTTAAVAANSQCYNFIGDPAIVMPVPRYNIVIETVDGKPYDPTQPTAVKPMTKTVVTGHLVRFDGHSAEAFTGDGLIEIFETPGTSPEVEVPNTDARPGSGDPTTKKITTMFDHKVVAESGFRVENGKFTATVIIPALPFYGDMNRIVITATDDISRDGAAVTVTNTRVAEMPHDFVSDLSPEAPVIEKMYIDTPDFTSGDIVSPNFKAFAEVAVPESGICISSDGVTPGARMVLDGTTHYSNILNTATYSDDKLIICQELTDLSDGRHTLSLYLKNNLDTEVCSEIEFYVVNGDLEGILTCTGDAPEAEGPAIARSSAEFDFTHNLEGDPEARLIILDSAGNTVFTATATAFPYTWNLRDSSGVPVADGLYRAKLMLSSGAAHGATKPVDFTVIKD